ncbi:hypothetical protein V1509DRAFT_651088 [Lipomyces kononenkoae]
MQNAIEMKSTAPTNPLGYIRQGKIYELLLEYGHAIEVYQEGLDMAATNARFYNTLNSMCLAASDMKVMAGGSVSGSGAATSSCCQTEDSVDFFQMLPIEVFVNILSHVPTHALFAFQRVSKTWQQTIVCTPRLWHRLDFTHTIQAVPISAIRYGLGHGGGNVEEILINNIVHRDANACMELVFRCGNNEEEGSIKPPGPRRLRRFRADFCVNFFSDWRSDWPRHDGFENIEELRIRFENSRHIVDMFAVGLFPKLRVLDCYATYDIVKSDEAVTYLNEHRVSISDVRPQPQLRVLRLGGPTQIKDLFPYIWESKTYVSTVKGIERLLKLTPELEEFHCINIRHGDGHQGGLDVHEDTMWAQRLNLRSLLPNLKVCNLDRSDLGGMPILPDSCECLYLDSNTYPRLCFRTRSGIEMLDNTDTAEYRMGDPVPHAVAMDAQLRDEYRNIRELFVLGLGRYSSLIERLGRFDRHNLTSLNISFCRIDWCGFASELQSGDVNCMNDDDFAINGLSRRPGNVSEELCDMFPNLARLGVAHTNLEDLQLGSFGRLEQLAYIDISGNVKLTAEGVTRFLTRAKPIKDEAADCGSSCRLKTLVASYCFLPADSIESWAKMGVDVRMDLIALRDSDWLLSDVKNGNKHVLYEDVTESHWYSRTSNSVK